MTAPTVISSSQAFWSKSMASAGQARTHDLQSEQTAQSRQRSASAAASSSLKPRRTSSQVVRRATPSSVCMMRRACGSSGSSSVRLDLDLVALVVPYGEQLLAAQEVVDRAGAAAAGGDGLDGRPGAHRGRVAAGEHAVAARSSSCRGSTAIWPCLDGHAVARRRSEVVDDGLADGEDDAVSGSSSTNSPSTGIGGRQPRSLGSPSVQRWNLTPVGYAVLPRTSTGTSAYSTCTCSCLPSSTSSGWPAPCARPRCRPGRPLSAPQRKAVRPAS